MVLFKRWSFQARLSTRHYEEEVAAARLVVIHAFSDAVGRLGGEHSEGGEDFGQAVAAMDVEQLLDFRPAHQI